ncbi:M28 family peptidase [Rhodohalobacter sulfatireducens]|uniref:M28 family peptidase n=1 Tax=Rhodohalobacter sulfatireducens TaxID=2911366 RepID=A0ABS9K8E6_9BACT|nr:M28 family peptidase [Rhodohalobacter sulfatireducens]MCG2587121.1 M28 family peptidase [Rhodohalobacter sulfatireducens]
MNKLFYCFIIFPALLISGCQSSPETEEAAQSITEEKLLSHIEVISSDEFEGRATASEGEEKTVNYLVNELESLGVSPGMDNGSYVQEFPLLGQTVEPSSASYTLKQNGQVLNDLEFRADFVAWPANEAEQVDVNDAELLYVGYGIQAPEFDWDDYKDADIEGKVLVFKNSDPSYDENIFGGEGRLYYGRWSYKFEKAADMGALGAIIIHTTPTAGYGWNVVSNSWSGEQFYLKSEEGEAETMPDFNSWLTEPVSAELFEAAGLNLNEMLEAADDPEFQPVPLDGITVDVDLEANYSNMSSRNVLGEIKGNDPDLMDQYLIFTAHYDHLGITNPVEGDSINNGALDNAAGVSSLLNLAEAYKMVQPEMQRSALFLFVGAEEMGLLGSKYWAANPTVHPGNVTANFNLDGMQVYGQTEDVVLVGYGRNTITDVFEDYAQMGDRTIAPDPYPEQGYFYRSDHFALAQIGIPAVFPNPGQEYINKPDDWSETVDSLDTANYHSVNDEINELWDLSGMEQDVRLFFRTSFDILNRNEMMEWYSGDEFEAVREEMLEEAP